MATYFRTRGGNTFIGVLCPRFRAGVFCFFGPTGCAVGRDDSARRIKRRNTMDTVKIKYIGHACFALSYKGTDIILDPYMDNMVPGLSNMREKADFVFCSHAHDDHGYLSAVELSGADEANFGLGELTVPHDDAEGGKRGWNTVRIFSFGPLRIAHMGDIGRTLTDAEAEVLRGVDCMMLPVGGFYTVGPGEAKTIAEQVQPRVLIPMHYSGFGYGFENIGTAKAFTELMGEEKLHYGGAEFELSEDTPAQIRVMRPAMLNVSVRDAGSEFHSQGYNCAQSSLKALGAYTGLDGAVAGSLGFGFGKGMHCEEVCGALTGALMAIGCSCLWGEMPNPCRPDATALSLEMEKRFMERFGTIMCRDILAEHQKTMCNECIAAAAEMAEEIIREYKNK